MIGDWPADRILFESAAERERKEAKSEKGCHANPEARQLRRLREQ